MLAAEIIRSKRDGHALTEAEIKEFVAGITDGSISDAQVGAFAMAVLLRGMNRDERVAMTLAMRDSGEVLKWELPGPVVDKHSTGGIGDNVSLVLAPILAACGAYVPMISGRGLGHTGGTLDKLDSIPGYRTQPDIDLLRKTVAKVGCAVIGQTADVAPADKRLYAIRDVTGTVETEDLITASILSKKLAAGIETLVLDVKCGTGAFIRELDEARQLAAALVDVANGAGCRTTALITDMNESLASAAGNALEVANAVELLRGDEVDARLWDVSVELSAELLVGAGISDTISSAREKARDTLQSGLAAETFQRMVTALGGPKDFVDQHWNYLPRAKVIKEVLPMQAGFVSAVEARQIGIAVIELGGGRRRAEDSIDYSVGFDWLAGCGAHVGADQPIARVHAQTEEAAERAADILSNAYTISSVAPAETPLFLERITS